MTAEGTRRYETWQHPLPGRVRRAVELAVELEFPWCVHPATGALLATLARGLPPGSAVLETGTGTGAGLAWMADAAGRDVSFLSVEVDPGRAAAARRLFADQPNVSIIEGDAAAHWYDRPWDLLVLDGGGGTGKQGDEPVDIARALALRGTIVIDDYTPIEAWPPMHEGRPDESRLHWLHHPRLHTTELRVAPDMAVLVGRRLE